MHQRLRRRLRCLVSIGLWAAVFVGTSTGKELANQPETVMVTYRVKSGSEAELSRQIVKHWRNAVELKLVSTSPHVVFRTSEDDKTCFVEVFTWRDSSIPDSPPTAIQTAWSEMGKLVESRGGKPGIDVAVVTLVDIDENGER